MEKISFVIPCYRSEHTISAVVDEIVDTVTAHGGYDYEIILVNDNSPDRVMDVITVLSQFNPRVKGLDLSRNFGQHSAIMAGFTYLTGDIVVCLDDDGQTPANEMFRLIDKLGDMDLVFASYKTKQHSGFRNFGSKVNDLMARWLLSKPKDLKIMSYFACKRYVVDEVLRYENPYPYMSGLLRPPRARRGNLRLQPAQAAAAVDQRRHVVLGQAAASGDHRRRHHGGAGLCVRRLCHYPQVHRAGVAARLEQHDGGAAVPRRHDYAHARHGGRICGQNLFEYQPRAAVCHSQNRRL